jgi:hypothetical protein
VREEQGTTRTERHMQCSFPHFAGHHEPINAQRMRLEAFAVDN